MARWFTPYDEAKAQGMLWTPVLLGGLQLRAWYCGNDLSSLSFAGSGIQTWRDKSHNGNDATQSTAANRPTYSAHDGAVIFDGTNDWMDIPDGLVTDVTDLTIGIVARPNATAPAGDQNMIIGSYFVPSRVYCNISNGTKPRIRWGNVLVESPDNVGVGTDFGMVGVARNSYMSLYVDGSFKGTTGITDLGDPSGLNIGSYDEGASSFFNGRVYELVFCASLGSVDRQKLEGYLAWCRCRRGDYQLVERLATGHPYKNRPPLRSD